MSSITLSHAKAQFSALIGNVRDGREYDITHHGKTVARIVPAERRSSENIARALHDLKRAKVGVKLGRTSGVSLKSLINKGRKW